MKGFIKLIAGGMILDFVRSRILHSPDIEVPDDALQASVTVEQWRAVEAVQSMKVAAKFAKW